MTSRSLKPAAKARTRKKAKRSRGSSGTSSCRIKPPWSAKYDEQAEDAADERPEGGHPLNVRTADLVADVELVRAHPRDDADERAERAGDQTAEEGRQVDRDFAGREQDPNRHGDRAEREHAAEHPAEVDDLRLARRRLLVVLLDPVELLPLLLDVLHGQRHDRAVGVRDRDEHQVAQPDEEPVHQQPLAEATECVPDGDVLHLGAVQHLCHLRVHPHERLGLAVHLDPVLQAEQLPLERLRRDRRHRDGHRPALADVRVGDLAVVVHEGGAKLLVALLGSVTRLADRPGLDELGEGDAPAPRCGRCRVGGGRVLVRVRDLGHPETPSRAGRNDSRWFLPE